MNRPAHTRHAPDSARRHRRLRPARLAALATTVAATLRNAAGAWAADAAKAVTDNPYGLQTLWTQSDAVAKTVLMILVVMSMGSW